jgi:hypothetical protein
VVEFFLIHQSERCCCVRHCAILRNRQSSDITVQSSSRQFPTLFVPFPCSTSSYETMHQTPRPLNYGCTDWRISSQRAADLYSSGTRLWTKKDLEDIEQQLRQSYTMERFSVRRIDGSIIQIYNPMFQVQNPIWYVDIIFWPIFSLQPKSSLGNLMSSTKNIGNL